MKISIPELSLVLLVGPSGCGKSSFARKHFLPTEVISSDFCRALVSDNENDQSATGDAFDLLHEIIRKRLTRGRLTVVDATNVQPEARKSLIALAKEFHLFAEAIVFDLPERLCQDRNALRPDRQFGPHVVRNQSNNSGDRCADSNARGSVTSSSSPVPKMSTPSRSSVSHCGTTGRPIMAPSTSSVMFMAVLMNWSNCWDSSAIRSIVKVMDIPSRQLMGANSSSSATWLIAVPARCRFFASCPTWFVQIKPSAFRETTT